MVGVGMEVSAQLLTEWPSASALRAGLAQDVKSVGLLPYLFTPLTSRVWFKCYFCIRFSINKSQAVQTCRLTDEKLTCCPLYFDFISLVCSVCSDLSPRLQEWWSLCGPRNLQLSRGVAGRGLPYWWERVLLLQILLSRTIKWNCMYTKIIYFSSHL